VDGRVCDQNETRRRMSFENGRWYRVRVRVTRERIRCWVDDDEIVDLETAGREFTAHHGAVKPFGVCSFQSSSALRNIRLRRLARK
ncbi:family 16 glycoside hydrolase, partial [Planctomycetota bacterium]